MMSRTADLRLAPLARLLLAGALVLCTVAGAGCAAEDPGPTQFVASTARVPFHLSTCNRVRRIPADKLIEFEDRDGALAAGHTPCVLCTP